MNDMDKTMAPKRKYMNLGADDMTMPGKRERKQNGRFAVGDLIMNRYKVLAELGQGGMGVVYKCFDETAGIEVALKALPPELSHNTLEMEDIKDNFQLVHNLHHPNIASSNNLERDNSNGNYYLIMECCKGEDLRRWLKHKRRESNLTLKDILPIVKQVADALDYAHKQKIIHRDIKPGNIMINADGDIKILDFGLAAQIHTSMTRVSMAYHGTSGTGPYMAPEQWRGRAQGSPADQYALAVMTYEMLAGHLPFESTDAAILREAVLHDTPEGIGDIPKTAQDAIKRAMSKEPAERFATCSDFVAALNGKKIKAAQKQSKGGLPQWTAILIFVALLGVGGARYYFFNQQQLYQKEQTQQEQLAHDKTEKELQEKLDAENAKIEQQEKLADKNDEKIKNQLIQENYRLQPQVKAKKVSIDQAQYDRGQTFGKYLDTLAQNFTAAEQAERNKDPVSANQFYKIADDAANWLIANAPLRQEFKSLQKDLVDAKVLADKFNASKLSSTIYTNAASQTASAFKDYEIGNFASAINVLKIAVENYKDAYAKSRKLTLDNLLNSAELAHNNKNWDQVKKIAEEIRPLDEKKANELTAYANTQIKSETLNKELAAARNAQTAQEWQQMYNHAVAALKIDSTCIEAQNLKQEAENNQIIAMHNKSRALAEAFFAQKEYKKAVAEYKKIPRDSLTQTDCQDMGMSYYALGDFANAEEYLLKAHNMGFNDTDCTLVRIYMNQEDYDRCVEILKESIKKENAMAELYLSVIYLRGLGGYAKQKEGKRLLILAANKKLPSAQFNLGCCYAKLNGMNFVVFEYSLPNAKYYLTLAKDNGVSMADEVLKALGE